jgi:hypothetical protein
MKIFNLSLIILALFFNCKNENIPVNQSGEHDNYLEIFYLQGEKLYPFRITCNMIRGEIFKKDRLELKIDDQKFVNQFLSLYRKYKASTETDDHDTRIQVLVHQGIKVDTLCMGGHYDTSINGKRMEDLPKLLKLIKDRLNQKN